MSRTLAHIASCLLHPMLMPTYGLLVIFAWSNSVVLLPYEAKRIILLIVAINTMALPMIMIPLFYKLNIITSINMHDHKERIFPIAFSLIPYIFSYFFLKRLPITTEIPYFLMGASVTIAVSLIISIWWKISIHMIGIGGVTGLFFILSYSYLRHAEWIVIVTILLAGIVAWARLKLNAHKPAQVYAGFSLGCITVAFCIAFFM